jgi:hypothetical protein
MARQLRERTARRTHEVGVLGGEGRERVEEPPVLAEEGREGIPQRLGEDRIAEQRTQRVFHARGRHVQAGRQARRPQGGLLEEAPSVEEPEERHEASDELGEPVPLVPEQGDGCREAREIGEDSGESCQDPLEVLSEAEALREGTEDVDSVARAADSLCKPRDRCVGKGRAEERR